MNPNTKFEPQAVALPGKHAIETFLKRYLPSWIVSLIIYGSSAIAIGIMGWLLFSSWKSLQEYQWQLDIAQLLISFLVYSVAVGVAVLAWGRMLNSFGRHPDWLRHTRAFCVARIGARLPGPLLHIPGRLLFYQGYIPTRLVLVGSAIELLVMLSACIVVSVLANQFIGDQLTWILGIIVIFLLIIFLPYGLKWLAKKRFIDLPHQIDRRNLIEWILLHIAVWILGATTLFFMINTFYDLSIDALPTITGAWAISGIVSFVVAFLPMGLGLRELSLGLLLSTVLPPGIAVLVAVLSRFLFLVFDLLLGGIAFLLPHSST